jgi:hypothetical protein
MYTPTKVEQITRNMVVAYYDDVKGTKYAIRQKINPEDQSAYARVMHQTPRGHWEADVAVIVDVDSGDNITNVVQVTWTSSALQASVEDLRIFSMKLRLAEELARLYEMGQRIVTTDSLADVPRTFKY